MSCCGPSPAQQQRSMAAAQGLVQTPVATLNPFDSGPYWREDWPEYGKIKIIFNGERAATNTIMRASNKDGFIDLFRFDTKTGRIQVIDGEPQTQRFKGAVTIWVDNAYVLCHECRESAKKLQYWEVLTGA